MRKVAIKLILVSRLLKKRIINAYRKFYMLFNRSHVNQLKEIESSFPKILSTTETIELIVNNNMSVSRYGDAEFDILLQLNQNDKYQKPSDNLSERLVSILKSSNEKLLVCIPPFNPKYNNTPDFYGSLSFWEFYWLKRFSKIHPFLVNSTYGNSFISRDSVFYENELVQISRIWNERNVVFVYGKNGRFNPKHEIFSNIKSADFIEVDPTNAFSKYESILIECKMKSKDSLFLVAAGPTASVLSYDLSNLGYQSIDIGHINNCYDQYQGIIDSPESLPLYNEK